jgi:hypothetical protein
MKNSKFLHQRRYAECLKPMNEVERLANKAYEACKPFEALTGKFNLDLCKRIFTQGAIPILEKSDAGLKAEKKKFKLANPFRVTENQFIKPNIQEIEQALGADFRTSIIDNNMMAMGSPWKPVYGLDFLDFDADGRPYLGERGKALIKEACSYDISKNQETIDLAERAIKVIADLNKFKDRNGEAPELSGKQENGNNFLIGDGNDFCINPLYPK